MTSQTFRQLARLTALLAFAVVVLGAYVRLTDAGLGCPDWPGCYGKLTVTEVMRDVSSAEAAFPERAVDAGKAWREMIHRYLAAILGLAIVALAVIAWRRRHIPGQPVALPIALVGLVIFQGLLGMWTVTLLLKPVVVMAHLLGGMTTLALLWWLSLSPPTADSGRHRLTSLALAGVAVVIVQIALGGWTSTNYAALACPAFPSCNGNWWPEMDFAEGFRLWRGLGVDYEGGVLHNSARMAIHYSHRIFALAVIIVLGSLIARGLRDRTRQDIRAAARLLAAALTTQLVVGIAIVKTGLPLSLATAHNAFAAVLLLCLLTMLRRLLPRAVQSSRQ